jgi:sugar lactone lactonase YvrE
MRLLRKRLARTASARAGLGLLAALAGILLFAAQAPAAQLDIRHFTAPEAAGDLEGISAGATRAMWMTDPQPTTGGPAIVKVSLSGEFTIFSGAYSSIFCSRGPCPEPTGITKGPDGNVWYTEPVPARIGRITPQGVVTEFTAGITPCSPDCPQNSPYPAGITAGPHGKLWFTERYGNRIGRITPQGHIKEFPLPSTDQPRRIVAGPRRDLWFTTAETVGRITLHGVPTIFTQGIGRPQDIALGADGALWFTNIGEDGKQSIGRITQSGAVTHYKVGVGPEAGFLGAITAGPDRDLWFTITGDPDQIGRVTLHGKVKLYPLAGSGRPPPFMYVDLPSITTGPDQRIWFTGPDRNEVSRFRPPSG